MDAKKKLDLYLEGPMQSWGTTEHWYKTRRTESYPTKTALTGLIGRCMGVDWDESDELQMIADGFTITCVKSNHDGSGPMRMSDDQIIFIGDYIDAGLVAGFVSGTGKPKSDGNNGVVRAQIFTKDYLEDTKFSITIEGAEDMLQRIRHALLHPAWPPYLGRACCIPSAPLVQGDIY